MVLSLIGYVTGATEKTFVLTGIDAKKWNSLDKTYWSADMHRRVSKNKKTCTVRVNGKTTFLKHKKSCGAVEMDGCYVKVIAHVKKYAFAIAGSSITGWCINAQSVQTMSL